MRLRSTIAASMIFVALHVSAGEVGPPVVISPSATAGRLDLKCDGTPLRIVVDAIATNAGLTVVYPFIEANETCTVSLKDVEPLAALRAILSVHDYGLEQVRPGAYVVVQTGTPRSPISLGDGPSILDSLTNAVASITATYLGVLAKPETSAQLARFDRNYFEQLVKAGFTEEQAFKLLLRRSPPLFQNEYRGQE